ncbi:hypothetical protein H2204_006656 [Knufia peltigerae]|uniref:Major facilitator superfamily (MFS) profile domain-containing protein n=1 Tax=Knufia peltigerae TaxID=1002370 RepID=A0AA38Y3B6_9EURO|nr:hypothetical protein H2204_006656 [Knufia peltigerae]
MGLGVLEDTKLPHVPGTVILDDGVLPDSFEVTGALKHAKGKNGGHIVLNPQPSDDPNDPLNWPLWKRDCLFLIHAFGFVCTAAVPSSLLAAATEVLADTFDVSITKITQLTGFMLLAVGSSGLFVSVLARLFGKRPQFVFASFMCLIGTVIGASAENYNTLLAGRMIQGLGACAYESMLVAIVGDLYFVHERGLRVAFFNFCFASLNAIGSLIAGPITTKYGWRYMFYIYIPFIGLQVLLVVFGATETSFQRNHLFETDIAADVDYDDLARKEAGETKVVASDDQVENCNNTATSAVPPKKTYWQYIAFYHGRQSHDNPIKLFLRPFAICLNPAIIWINLIGSLPIASVALSNFTTAQMYGPPPYNLNPTQLGYMFVGPLVGPLLVTALFLVASDPLALWMARRNNGVFEPEFRLPMALIVGGSLMAIGIFGWGNLYEAGDTPVVGSVILAFYTGGMSALNIASGAYTVDAYREVSVELVIIVMVVKNFLFFGLSYFFNNAVAARGPAFMFNIVGGIVLFGVVILGIPVYMFGKRIRGWWCRAHILKKLHLE